MEHDNAPIEGTRDLLQADLARSLGTKRLLQDFLASYGYASIDLPVLERTSLYLRKLGSRIAGSMFNLTDQRGERLSLRPELTASAIRAFMRRRQELVLPVRWQYCGPVFRDREAGDRLRQFTQLGAELIGSGTRRADAELLAVSCGGLQALGLTRTRLVLGHAGLIPSVLDQIPLSERARIYLAGHVDLLRTGPEGIDELRRGLAERQLLAGDHLAPDAGAALAQRVLGEAESEGAVNLVGWLLSEGASRSTGRRSTDQIVRRFQAKLHGPDDPQQLDRALSLTQRLAAVRAAPREALAQGRDVLISYGLGPGPLSELDAIVSLLDAQGVTGGTVEIDLGLTRALGYYTGIVFELYADSSAPVPIAGGGRYDGLVRALGGADDVPALGFAYTLEELETALPPPPQGAKLTNTVLVVPESDAQMALAAQHMETLRGGGLTCLLEVVDRTEEQRRRYCATHRITRIDVVGPSGIREVAVKELHKTYASAGAR